MNMVYAYTGPNDVLGNTEALLSVIKTLKNIKDKDVPVTVVVNNHYVVKGLNDSMDRWLARGWKNANGRPIANKGHWVSLHILRGMFTDIKFIQPGPSNKSIGRII